LAWRHAARAHAAEPGPGCAPDAVAPFAGNVPAVGCARWQAVPGAAAQQPDAAEGAPRAPREPVSLLREAAMVATRREVAASALPPLAVQQVAMEARDVRRALRHPSSRPAARRRRRMQPARRKRSGQLLRCDRLNGTQPYSCAILQISKNNAQACKLVHLLSRISSPLTRYSARLRFPPIAMRCGPPFPVPRFRSS
jgi:hypothetical protein